MPYATRNHPPSGIVSITIFLLATGLMGYLRLYLFAHAFIPLTYGLPLLICLWHRDRLLLWGMTLAFSVMSAFKSFWLLPPAGDPLTIVHWSMQIMNIVVLAVVVHIVMNLTERIQARNAELEQANEELAAREEEISHQNEELQVQSEEVAQQNEELQQQSEELQHQSEELQAQSEELQVANTELTEREAMLRKLLESLRFHGGNCEALEAICHSALELLGGVAAAAALVERYEDQLLVRAQAGLSCEDVSMPFDGSFAAVVVEQGRTAYIADLKARPDLIAARFNGRPFRSVLAAPLRVRGAAVGAVELFSEEPMQWTTEHFRIIEWVSAQSSLILEVQRLHDELAQTNLNLEKAVQERTARLQEMVEELEHFSYSITHDMRAPLRAMQGFAELLAVPGNGSHDGERQDYLDRIVTAAARMDRLITDALSYSKSVRQEMTLAPIDARKLLKGMIDSYPEFQDPRATIEIQDQMPNVLANEAGLTQCFSNLLNNAVKFVNPDQPPQVRVRAERLGDSVRLWFEDNGIGIPQDMTPRMFRMFQRGSRKYEGTGIGLALVRKVTERMGGKVGVESEPGKGSRFWVELKAAIEGGSNG
jgi:signal transduction histidine kinase